MNRGWLYSIVLVSIFFSIDKTYVLSEITGSPLTYGNLLFSVQGQNVSRPFSFYLEACEAGFIGYPSESGYICLQLTTASIDAVAVISFFTCLMIILTIILMIFLFIKRRDPVVIRTQVFFAELICVGALLCYFSIFIWIQVTSATCLVTLKKHIYCHSNAIFLLVTGMAASSWTYIDYEHSDRKTISHLQNLFLCWRHASSTHYHFNSFTFNYHGWLCGNINSNFFTSTYKVKIFYWIGLLILWSGISPPELDQEENLSSRILIQTCGSLDSKDFLWLVITYEAILFLVGFILAFLSRNIPESYNESQFIGFAVSFLH